jgi:hypothetical protein
LPDFSWYNIPKWVKVYQIIHKLPNGPKICTPNGSNIFQLAIKCTNTFQSEALQNLPKLEYLVRKDTIWQPWTGRRRVATDTSCLAAKKFQFRQLNSSQSTRGPLKTKGSQHYWDCQKKFVINLLPAGERFNRPP